MQPIDYFAWFVFIVIIVVVVWVFVALAMLPGKTAKKNGKFCRLARMYMYALLTSFRSFQPHTHAILVRPASSFVHHDDEVAGRRSGKSHQSTKGQKRSKIRRSPLKMDHP